MYDEMTVLDLIATAFEKINAGDEYGPLITELASRLSRAQVYRENLARIANMLERLSLTSAHVEARRDGCPHQQDGL